MLPSSLCLSVNNRGTRLFALTAIVALAAAVRFYALGSESLWFDEAFSVNVADWNPLYIVMNLTDIGLRSTDRNIFNLMLHYILLLGRSEAMVRAIPAISGVLSVVALYALGKRLFGPLVGLLAAFLLALSPMDVWYSREARAYALLALLGILTAYFMVRALDDDSSGSWLGYAILAAMGIYTHSFGMLVFAALNVFVVLAFAVQRPSRPRIVHWFLAQSLVAITLLPFVRSFATQTSAGWGAWIAEKYGVPTIKSLAMTMGMFSFSTAYDNSRLLYAIGLLVFAAPCLAALTAFSRIRRRAWWAGEGRAIVFALIYLVIPIGMLFVASQFTPLYLERYLLPFLPPYLLIIGCGLQAIRRPDWRILVMIAILIVTVPALLAVYQPGQKEDWRGAAAYVSSAGIHEGDMIVFYDAYTSIPFNYYYRGNGQQLSISRFATDDELARHVDDMLSAGRTVWLILSHAGDTRLTTMLEARPGVKLLANKDFLGVSVARYEVHALP